MQKELGPKLWVQKPMLKAEAHLCWWYQMGGWEAGAWPAWVAAELWACSWCGGPWRLESQEVEEVQCVEVGEQGQE